MVNRVYRRCTDVLHEGHTVRVVLGAVLWVAVAGGLTALYGVDSSDAIALLVFVGILGASLVVGYLVGDEWALTGPVAAMVILSVILLAYSAADPGVGFALVALWFVGGLLCLPILAGISMRKRRGLDR